MSGTYTLIEAAPVRWLSVCHLVVLRCRVLAPKPVAPITSFNFLNHEPLPKIQSEEASPLPRLTHLILRDNHLIFFENLDRGVEQSGSSLGSIFYGLHTGKLVCESLSNSGKPLTMVIPCQAFTDSLAVKEGVET